MKRHLFGPQPKSSEITPESVFRQRRTLLAGLAAGAAAPWLPAQAAIPEPGSALSYQPGRALAEENTPKEMALTYNNFYELGLGKDDPVANAGALVTDPWSVTVSGACAKPGTLTLEDILKPHALEERIYRLRCVEAWSMVVPWVGFGLGDLLKRFEPTSNAKYVAFKTLVDPERLPGQRSRSLDWPYREGLRIDEAMNPLSMMVVGAYGEALRGQMGAPLRLMVPWKYGFKSIKSIVEIEFTETQPETSWNLAAANEYGFYANVNPQVDHPRWSQARERRIDASSAGFSGLFAGKRDTLMFNGYGEQVASLYSGMDLSRNY